MRILFVGDSLTDAHRNYQDPNDLGEGYCRYIMKEYPASTEAFNRGINGSMVKDVLDRFAADLEEARPDIISIFVGVNDMWSHVGKTDFGTELATERFKETYRELLEKAVAKGCQVIVVEPFLIPVDREQRKWTRDLDLKRKAIRELAEELEVEFVPLNTAMNQLAEEIGIENLTNDGIHVKSVGHQLIAEKWLQA